MNDLLLNELLLQLELEGIEAILHDGTFTINNHIYEEAATVIYDVIGDCPYNALKVRQCKECTHDYCDENCHDCWVKYIENRCKQL